jgi:hypothetical protein
VKVVSTRERSPESDSTASEDTAAPSDRRQPEPAKKKHDCCFTDNTVNRCKKSDCEFADVHNVCRICKKSGHIMWQCHNKSGLRSLVGGWLDKNIDPLTLKMGGASKYANADAALTEAKRIIQ